MDGELQGLGLSEIQYRILTKQLQQVDADILKPTTSYLTVEHHKGTPGKQSGVISPAHSDVEPVSEGEEDEVVDLAPSKGED
ncbi:uncharacterized protein EDB91DRAFT_1254904 [Suillus paluster]|uniref:uncharacterized protein n=1 Tax=Suillus paluster TaxID=48578 RepID=UPI001B85C5E0|nr:uncharacterized protein EDB91DRAFT_1254904 [Suillus paluster]KAG1725167.1 hypothetical protein EDB91DRAFT_1254904 [Suillus paluster]